MKLGMAALLLGLLLAGCSGSTTAPGGPSSSSSSAAPDRASLRGAGPVTAPILFRRSTGRWYIASGVGPSGPTADAQIFYGGDPSDIPVTGDFDGNGSRDVGVFRRSTGVWYLLTAFNSAGPISDVKLPYGGASTDLPMVGDWDGDGRDDPGLYRATTGQWFLLSSWTAAGAVADLKPVFGGGANLPAVGDFDGDGTDDLAIFDPGTGRWQLDTTRDGVAEASFVYGGAPSDVPLAGDFDEDGREDPALYRRATGQWFMLTGRSGSTIQSDIQVHYGGDSTDLPVVGDWNGDGAADPGVYRRGTGGWYVLTGRSGNTTTADFQFRYGGDATDFPLTSAAAYEVQGALPPRVSGILVGTGGLILTTEDGGASWNERATGLTRSLYGVDHLPGGEGYAVGDAGTVLRTRDWGRTWTQQAVPTAGQAGYLSDVRIPRASRDGRVAVAAGPLARVLRTADAGATWVRQDSGNDPISVSFPDEWRGLAADTTVRRTLSQGTAWAQVLASVGSYWDTVALPDWQGFAIQDGGTTTTFLKTFDSGRTWSNLGVLTGNRLRTMFFLDSGRGWVLGDGGMLHTTSTGGFTWSSRNIGIGGRMVFVDAQRGWILTTTRLYATADGGVNWTEQTLPPLGGRILFDLSFAVGPTPPASPTENLLESCGDNLRTVVAGVGRYAEANSGRYPASLSGLPGLASIPTCPSAGSDTYSSGYSALSNPDAFTVVCSGSHHTSANYPQYNSVQGLVKRP